MGLSTVETFKKMPVSGNMIELSSTQLQQLQSVLLLMLKDIESACASLGVTYTMSGGSCLGAVRHRGFIPWDDDVDLNMSRRDFKRFSEGFSATLGDKYILQIPSKTEGYELAFPRVRMRNTIVRSREDFDTNDCGAYVDIFFIDSIPNGAVFRKIHGLISMSLGFAWSCRRFRSHRKSYYSWAQGDRRILSAFKRKAVFGLLFSIMPVLTWAHLWDTWNGLIDDNKTRYVSIPVGRKHYFGEIYERDDFFPVSMGKFCGLDVSLPANPDAYLRSLYGEDYMVLPPESEREKHIVLEFDLSDVVAKLNKQDE